MASHSNRRTAPPHAQQALAAAARSSMSNPYDEMAEAAAGPAAKPTLLDSALKRVEQGSAAKQLPLGSSRQRPMLFTEEVEQEVGKLKAKSTQQLQEFVEEPIPKGDKTRREYVRTQLVTSGNYEALWQKMLRINESMDKNSPDLHLRNKQLGICVAVAAMRLLDEASSAGKKVQVSHLVGWASTPEGWQAVGG